MAYKDYKRSIILSGGNANSTDNINSFGLPPNGLRSRVSDFMNYSEISGGNLYSNINTFGFPPNISGGCNQCGGAIPELTSEHIINKLKSQNFPNDFHLVGSIARHVDNPNDIDIVTIKPIKDVYEYFKKYYPVSELKGKNKQISFMINFEGKPIKIDVWKAEPKSLQYTLFSRIYDKVTEIKARKKAQKLGLKLTNNGLYKNNKLIPIKSYDEIFDILELKKPEIKQKKEVKPKKSKNQKSKILKEPAIIRTTHERGLHKEDIEKGLKRVLEPKKDLQAYYENQLKELNNNLSKITDDEMDVLRLNDYPDYLHLLNLKTLIINKDFGIDIPKEKEFIKMIQKKIESYIDEQINDIALEAGDILIKNSLEFIYNEKIKKLSPNEAIEIAQSNLEFNVPLNEKVLIKIRNKALQIANNFFNDGINNEILKDIILQYLDENPDKTIEQAIDKAYNIDPDFSKEKIKNLVLNELNKGIKKELDIYETDEDENEVLNINEEIEI